MANNCFYTMGVAGYRDNVDAFVQIMQNNYDKIHMYRIFDATVFEQNDYGLYRKVKISGDCAWSVYCCMMPGSYSYYDGITRPVNLPADVYTKSGLYGPCELGRVQEYFPQDHIRYGTHLLHEAARLNLTIEVYSTECGMGFCEVYKILPGGIKVKDLCGDYNKVYIGDCDSYEQFKQAYEAWPELIKKFPEDTFYRAKKDREEYIELAQYEYEDTIPNKPNYICKNIMYKLVDKK